MKTALMGNIYKHKKKQKKQNKKTQKNRTKTEVTYDEESQSMAHNKL